jgi:hypothetical protein
MLLEDLRVPLVRLTADLGDPVQARVVELLHVLDAFHEQPEVLELRALVVRRRDGTSTSIDPLESGAGLVLETGRAGGSRLDRNPFPKR